jgi:hypothetical protein
MAEQNEVTQKALLLISTFKNAIDKGYKHFDKSGKELTTVKEILETLRSEGSVMIQEPK